MQGYCLERKYRGHGRAGGVACYIRHDLIYKRLNDMQVHVDEPCGLRFTKENASKMFMYAGSMFMLYSKEGVFKNT